MTDFAMGEPWSAARSLDDLAAATIAFLEGRLRETPLHAGPPDSETCRLIPDLVTMNRAGFVTTNTQPGLIDAPAHYVQRAYVEGICNEAIAAKVYGGLLSEDLVAISFGPGSNSYASIVVTVDDGAPFTFLGRSSADELDHLRNGHASLDADLDVAWTLQVFDPTWGRNDHLWPALLRALSMP